MLSPLLHIVSTSHCLPQPIKTQWIFFFLTSAMLSTSGKKIYKTCASLVVQACLYSSNLTEWAGTSRGKKEEQQLWGTNKPFCLAVCQRDISYRDDLKVQMLSDRVRVGFRSYTKDLKARCQSTSSRGQFRCPCQAPRILLGYNRLIILGHRLAFGGSQKLVQVPEPD